MAVRIGDTLKQINNADFPIVEAMDVAFESGDTLQELYDSGALSGGGSGTSYIELSEEEYFALSDEQRASEVEYRTYDTGRIFKRGVEYGKETDISGKQDDLHKVKFTMRRNSVNEPRYCLIGSSDLTKTLLMNEPYRFDGTFGSNNNIEKSITSFTVSFKEGVGDPSRILRGFTNNAEGFKYVDLLITVDETENLAYAYVDFLQENSLASGEITKPFLDAESYMDFAESFELVDTYKGTLVCKMSDYCKVITEISDEVSDSTVWSSKKTSDEIAKVDASLGELSTLNTVKKSDANECILDKEGQGNFYVEYEGSNLPNNEYSHWYINTVAQNKNAQKQVAYSTHTDRIYIRKYVSYKFSDWQELATMDKVALKHEQFDKKVTLTDSNWKYKKLTFTKSYMNTPSVNVSCGDYLNPEFYSYWGCEAYIININNEGCTIRYRSSKASESEPLEVNIIVFVNGI